jgi:hypothetical protein
MHPLLFQTPKENCGQLERKILRSDGRVRIAILDTGMDLPNHVLWSPGSRRIRSSKSWVRSKIGEDEVEDLDGHGTHAVGLLLKVAPEADIYVARVFEKNNEREGAVSTLEINAGIAKVRFSPVNKTFLLNIT